jgi:hypothetical protein
LQRQPEAHALKPRGDALFELRRFTAALFSLGFLRQEQKQSGGKAPHSKIKAWRSLRLGAQNSAGTRPSGNGQ